MSQVLFFQETFLPSYLISSPGVPFSTPTTDKILNKNHKKVDLPDLVSMTDNFEKRADVLLDGIKQLFDCETPSIDEEKSNYDVDVTRSPILLSTLQLRFELLQADRAANSIEQEQKKHPTSYGSYICDIKDYINKNSNIFMYFCMCWSPFSIWES